MTAPNKYTHFEASTMMSLMLMIMMIECKESQTKTLMTKPPHIVFIVADDLGWNDVGWHNPEMITPNLNWLAKRGVILDSVYAQSACTPSRNSFMTGLFPYHTELQDVIEPSVPLYLPLKHVLLPERLKKKATQHILLAIHTNSPRVRLFLWVLRGKRGALQSCERLIYAALHELISTGEGPQCNLEDADSIERQISASVSFETVGSFLSSALHMRGSGTESGRDFRFNDTVWKETEGTYSTHAFAKRAIDIIMRHDVDKPLFLYLPFQSPHSPLSVPKTYERLYSHIKSRERRVYSGMVSALDEAVGNITSALYKTQIIDNLLLVFTSDNGGHPYMGGSNKPLRGGKKTIWEGGTRVPTFVYSSTLLRKKGYVNKELFHAVDWYPTFVEMSGAKPVRKIDGISQWKMLSRGGRTLRKEFVYDIKQNGTGAIRVGDYKLIVGRTGFHNDWYPTPGELKISRKRFRGGRFDMVRLSKAPHMLFNIKDDPEERFDISNDKPEILQSLLLRYKFYNSTKVVPYRPARDSAADPRNFNGFWSPGWC